MAELTAVPVELKHSGHRSCRKAAAIASAGSAIREAMDGLADLDREAVRRQRWDKFLAIGRTLG